MSNLKQEMSAYSDERIINTIKQQNFFGPEATATAKEIALERAILTADQIENISDVIVKTEAHKSAQPYTPKTTEASIGIGAVIFIIYMIIKYAIRASDM